jgi:cell division transport system permease protein
MFSTVRLAIYSFREEIDIMRLVGASRWYIQGPFLLQSVMIALVAVAVSSILLFSFTEAISGPLRQYFFDSTSEQFDIHRYAVDHWFNVIGLQIICGTGLAVFSTFIGIRRYLRR